MTGGVIVITDGAQPRPAALRGTAPRGATPRRATPVHAGHGPLPSPPRGNGHGDGARQQGGYGRWPHALHVHVSTPHPLPPPTQPPDDAQETDELSAQWHSNGREYGWHWRLHFSLSNVSLKQRWREREKESCCVVNECNSLWLSEETCVYLAWTVDGLRSFDNCQSFSVVFNCQSFSVIFKCHSVSYLTVNHSVSYLVVSHSVSYLTVNRSVSYLTVSHSVSYLTNTS